MKILVLNCGSSSAKYLVFDWDSKESLCKGIVERVTIGGSFCVHEVTGRDPVKIVKECPTHKEAVQLIMELLVSPEHGVLKSIDEISAVGHRVLHGGAGVTKSVKVTDEVIQAFKDAIPLGPLHNPGNILGIEAAREAMPGVPQMAMIDTAWGMTMEPPQYMYAVPYEWYEKYHIRRYGFHGTSHLYLSRRCAALLGKDPFKTNLITLHIGNGASTSAVKNGVCFDTSMGVTPQEGLVMGTRAGDHDATLNFYIMQKEGYTPDDMNNIINKKSGLLGITGKYADLRDVMEAMERGEERAKLAFEMECYRLKKYIGAYFAALEGNVDAIVWSAGAGEMSPPLRAHVMDGLEFLGIKYDPEKNNVAHTRNAESDISAPDSKVKIFVIPTDEERVIIEDVIALLNGTYDVHTNFTYSFQDPHYHNQFRDREFAKQLEKHPEMAKAKAKLVGE